MVPENLILLVGHSCTAKSLATCPIQWLEMSGHQQGAEKRSSEAQDAVEVTASDFMIRGFCSAELMDRSPHDSLP